MNIFVNLIFSPLSSLKHQLQEDRPDGLFTVVSLAPGAVPGGVPLWVDACVDGRTDDERAE